MFQNFSKFALFSSCFLTATSVMANDDKTIQFFLNQLGFNAGVVDGLPGKKTKSALKQFYTAYPNFDPKPVGLEAKNDLIQTIIASGSKTVHYGLCQSGPRQTSDKGDNYSNGFSLSDHKRVVTELPRYRSFSFGTTDPTRGGAVSPEIKGVGDINNDGFDDIVIDYYETGVPPIFLLGTSTGKFQKLDFSDPAAARRHVRNGELVDINADGYLDFVGFTTGDPARVWQESGYQTEGRQIPRGEPDLLLVNEGGRTFRHVPIPEIRRNDWNHGGTTADLNADGHIDIIPLSEGEREKTAPVINLGNGAFKMGKYEYSKEISRYLTSDVDSADFNNDGHQDLVFVARDIRPQTSKNNNEIGTIRVLYGDGDFDFRDNLEVKFGEIWLSEDQEKRIFDNFNGSKTGRYGEVRHTSTGSGNVEAIDVDSDGLIDILEGQYFTVSGLWSGSGFKFYRNTGECFYDATDEFFPNQKTNRSFRENIFTRYIHNFHQADINHDGRPDIVLQTDGSDADWTQGWWNRGFPYVFINQDNETFLPVSHIGSDVSGLIGLDDIVPGDFNGDGLTDILGIYSNNEATEIRAFFKRKAVDWSTVADTFQGDYEVEWFIGNVNEGNKLEFMGSETLILKDGDGAFNGNGSFQPSADLRKKLDVNYEPSGDIIIKGRLDLFAPGKSYETVFEGNIVDGELETYWQEGDLMVMKLTKKK